MTLGHVNVTDVFTACLLWGLLALMPTVSTSTLVVFCRPPGWRGGRWTQDTVVKLVSPLQHAQRADSMDSGCRLLYLDKCSHLLCIFSFLFFFCWYSASSIQHCEIHPKAVTDLHFPCCPEFCQVNARITVYLSPLLWMAYPGCYFAFISVVNCYLFCPY